MSLLRHPKFKVVALAGLAVVLIFILLNFFFHQKIKYIQTRSLLGTFVQIQICATRSEWGLVLTAFDKSWKRLEEINARMNVYSENSDIAKINRSYPHAIKVHPDTYQVLAFSKKYGELTRGAFDITIWPLVVLWKDAQDSQKLPSQKEIQRVKEAIGSDKIKLLSDNQVQLMHPRTKIDLSAIGQGYAADEASKILRKEGLRNFLVDTGGEIFAQGFNEQGQSWSVGIKDPWHPEKIAEVVLVTERGVSTSGNYEKYYTIHQKKYSHIIDPRSGYPANHVASATVVCANATQADVFSTALCVLGIQDGAKLLQSLLPDAAIIVMEQHSAEPIRVYKNRAYQKLFVSKQL